MYQEILDNVGNIAISKATLLKKSIIKYLLLSMMAGIFVGLGVILIATIGGTIGPNPFRKTIMGASFGIALSLVVMVGSELFTGNNFIMMIGSLQKKVSWGNSIKIWIVSYIGNLVGSIILAWLYVSTGLVNGPLAEFFIALNSGKMSASASNLFFKGILCNLLVCLAVFCFIKMKTESGKLIMIFWCLFAFITSGFEHSIANMTIFSVGLMAPHPETMTLSAAAHNLLYVTLGNFVGGAFLLGATYWYIGSDK